jgi:hypothetical protein
LLEAAAEAEEDAAGQGAASVGVVVESRGTMTEPEVPFEEAMEAVKKENLKLFDEGRALQATYRSLAKKLAAARSDASKVGR